MCMCIKLHYCTSYVTVNSYADLFFQITFCENSQRQTLQKATWRNVQKKPKSLYNVTLLCRFPFMPPGQLWPLWAWLYKTSRGLLWCLTHGPWQRILLGYVVCEVCLHWSDLFVQFTPWALDQIGICGVWRLGWLLFAFCLLSTVGCGALVPHYHRQH